MWSQVIKIASLSKGALVVGVAASAAMVSNAEFTNTPSHNELPSATPEVRVTPATSSRPANSPSASTEQKKSEVPKAQLPAATTSPSSPSAAALQHGVVPEIFKECVERYLAIRELGDKAPDAERQAVGEVCRAALAQSGLSPADFWEKFGPQTKSTAPKAEPTANADLETLVKECIAQRQAGTADQSDACHRAIAASGLTPQEFWTKVDKYLATTKPELSTEVRHWVQECVTKYTNHATDASQVCIKAIGLTGLTSSQFAERYLNSTKPTTTPALTKPVTNTAELAKLVARCLDLYKTITSTGGDTKAASDACRIAIQASGLSPADFWAKYRPTTATN